MSGHVGDGGSWKEPESVYVGVGGGWAEVVEAWVGDAGTWKPWYTAAPAAPVWHSGYPSDWVSDVNDTDSLGLRLDFAWEGLLWVGTWNSFVFYSPGNVVQNTADGKTYVAIGSGSNHQPPNASYWEELTTTFEVFYRVGASMAGDPEANADGSFELVAGLIEFQAYQHHTGGGHGTTVYYQARTKEGAQVSDFSAEASATVSVRVPAAPTSVTAGYDYPTLLATVSWTQPSPNTETGYRVQARKKLAGGSYDAWATVATPGANDTTEDIPVLDGYQYEFQVRAEAPQGNSAYATSNFIQVHDTPDAPSWTGGTPSLNGGDPTGSVDLAWTVPNGTVDEYEVRYRESGGSWPGSPQITGLTGTSTTVSGLSSDTTYEFQVRAVNDWGDVGDWSSTGTETTDAAAPETAPAWTVGYPQDDAATDQAILLRLQAASGDGTLAYQVYYRVGASMGTDPTATGTLLGNFSQAQIVDAVYSHATGQAHGTTLYYRARATNAGGNGPWNTEASATVQMRAPGDPYTVAATWNDVTYVATVSWLQGSPDNETSYDVEYRYKDCGGSYGSWTTMGPNAANDMDDTLAVLEGRVYQFRVRATNAGGSSSWVESNEVTVQETPSAPSWSGGTPTKDATYPATRVDLAWTTPDGTIDSYEVRYRIQGNSWPGSPQLTGLTGNSYEVTGLNGGNTYEFQIRAVNDCGGVGDWSSTGTETTDEEAPTTAPATITLSAKAGTDDTVTVLFTAVAEATSYEVWLSLTPGASSGTKWSTEPTGPGSYDIDVAAILGATGNDQVYVNVRGKNDGGSGPFGTEDNAYTLRTAPEIVSVTANYSACPGQMKVDVVWNHQNGDGVARTNDFQFDLYDGSWTYAGAESGGDTTTTVNVDGETSIRVYYTNETSATAASSGLGITNCPE